MLYVGVDIHKKNLEVCVLDEDGNRLSGCKVANLKESGNVCLHYVMYNMQVSSLYVRIYVLSLY